MHTMFGWGNVKVRAHSEDIDVGGRIMINWILKK